MPLIPQLKSRKAIELMRLDEAKLDEKEVSQAERTRRLVAFFNSDLWVKDFLPILYKLHDDYLDEVKKKTVSPDVLKVLDDFIVRLGGEVQLGLGAMERIAARRMAGAQAKQSLQDKQLEHIGF